MTAFQERRTAGRREGDALQHTAYLAHQARKLAEQQRDHAVAALQLLVKWLGRRSALPADQLLPREEQHFEVQAAMEALALAAGHVPAGAERTLLSFTTDQVAMLRRIVDEGMWEVASAPHTPQDETTWDAVCAMLEMPGYRLADWSSRPAVVQEGGAT